MNKNDCKQVLFYAAEIFNERMGTMFNEENLVLSCFQTSNQEEVFEQFCKQYFPDRLTDRYKEEGYCAYFLLGAAFVFSVDILEGIEE